MRTLLALLLTSSPTVVPSEARDLLLAGYHEHQSLDVRTHSRIQLLEDDRLTPRTRPLVEAAYARGETPCETRDSSNTAFCASIERRALRPAIVRLANAADKELGRLTLERATATLSRLPLTRRDSVFAVTVDLSANAGSYSGPIVRFLNVDGGRLAWSQVVDDASGRNAELDLPTTLKTGWHVAADASRPEILLVACRPDLSHASASNNDAAFTITYSRLYLASRQWHKVERRVAGCWESDDDFPARTLFP